MNYKLSGSLGDIINTLSTTLDTYPRREPGTLLLEGIPFQYADMHSFYHQSVQIFAHRLYDFESSVSNPLILDCGGHIGLASLFFVQRYPNCRILAFEADQKIAGIFSSNMASFGITNVDVIASAVWTNNDGVVFNEASDDSGSIAAGAKEGVKVPTTRLRDVLQSSQVELVKMDIEGAEFDVIQDCADVLTKSRCYIIEAHMLDGNSRLGSLLSLFEQKGFKYVISDLHQAVWMPPNQKPPFFECKTDRYLVSVFAWLP